MAKRSKSKSKQKKQTESESAADSHASKISLADIDAISSDDDDDDFSPDAYDTNPKAKSLRQAIANGKFDHLLEEFEKKLDSSSAEEDGGEDEFEEVVLAGDSGDEDSDEDVDSNDDDDNDDAPEDQGEKSGKTSKKSGETLRDTDEAENEDQSDDDLNSKAVIQAIFGNKDSDDDNKETPIEESDDEGGSNHLGSVAHKNVLSAKALSLVVQQLESAKGKMPWAETFDIVSSEPLPFGDNNDGNPLDVHDDLKREVAFYNMALSSVHDAKPKCAKAGVPFSRPDDFFAEMVKTDDHMAKVKDRLIFETKKMEAVSQRKSNREHKLRAKESQANKQAEKAKRKKDHFQQLADWADTAASQRGGALGDDVDDAYLQRMGGGGSGPSKKRQAADRKYGFGGKRGRFKQNDRKTLDDTSAYNWRGNFGGLGTKKKAGGSGADRKGKRARDASRSKR